MKNLLLNGGDFMILVLYFYSQMGEFTALVGKNWILYKRGCCGNIFQILIPIFFVGFVILVTHINPPILYVQQAFLPNIMYSQTVDFSSGSLSLMKKCRANSVIALVPQISTIVTKLNTILTANSKSTQLFGTEASLEAYIRSPSYSTSTKICWAVVVQEETLGGSYKYKLRFNITQLGTKRDGPLSNLPLTQDAGIDLDTYLATLWNGMVGTNNLVNDAILQIQSASSNSFFKKNISPAYQEEYLLDEIYKNLSQSVGTMFLLPLLVIYLRQTSSMLSEKESKVRESMRIMGMRMRYYYLTWFMRYFITYAIVHGVASGVLAYQLKYVPFYVPYILFLLFDAVIIIQNFFVQVFLSRAKLGVVITLLFFVLQFVVSLLISNNIPQAEDFNNLMSIVPHVAYILAFSNILYFQSKQVTASFTASINNYTLRTAIFSFAGNILLYLVLLWYLDQVIPSQWGAKRHPLFCCFQKSFDRSSVRVYPDNGGKRRGAIEQVDKSFKLMEQSNEIIEIAGLRKQFNGGDLVAVDDLNLNIYKNQIFVLLGHNGAGKTTTISMLTGLLEPTEGFISVFGETEMDSIRKMLGVCPQHDTLYEDLTVQEHLKLYATFKGLDGQQGEAEINKLIKDVNLQEKRDQYTKNLSGGQKRRLSVAIAFAGKSKAIILDEPTSGMDTSARRYIWDLLKTYKNDRIIILTTHFMDEADFLGDRIGIMGGGQLLCCGSSIFLKNRFGIGYNITFVKRNSQSDSEPIVRIVQKQIPQATVLSSVSSQLAIQLPLKDVRKFSALFQQLDGKRSQLKILEYGISITTLQEVFLRVAEEGQQQNQNKYTKQERNFSQPQVSNATTSPTKLKRSIKSNKSQSDVSYMELVASPGQKSKRTVSQDIQPEEIPRYNNQCTRFNIHFKATFRKRFRVIKRDIKTFLFQLVLPLAVIISALFLMKVSFINDSPCQYINVDTYLQQQNPFTLPVGSSNAVLLTSITNKLATKYGSKLQLNSNTIDITAANFDKLYLSPIKRSKSKLKGGIFFLPSATSGGKTIYEYYSLVITRSPTSTFFLPNLAAQTIINSQLGKNISITVANHPLPLTYSQIMLNSTISGFLGAFIFTLALSFKFASIVSFIVKERVDRVKHQQIVSGMKLSAYWFANFIYDYLLYLVVAIPSGVLCKVLDVTALVTGTAETATWLLFFSYGLAYIPFTYIIAFAYKQYGGAQSYYFFLTFLIGGMLPVLTLVLRIISASSNQIGRYIAWGLRVYPAFAFGQGIINLGSVSSYSTIENYGNPIDPFSLEVTLAPILYLIGGFIIYTILLFVIEAIQNSESIMRCCSREGSITQTAEIIESDVLAEYQNANSAYPEDYQILTQHLRKVFMIDGKKSYKVAVDNMSFGIKRGEVFGLLGVNGAGKSTTFKMLSGEITSTSGDSYFCGLKISDSLDKIRQSLGYCPQFDALVETLTVREQIQLYYDLKSLEEEYKQAQVKKKIKELNLQLYENKLSGTLSGGNKRKLSVAIAMIGSPKIIFLDEPSTGMDPKARRFMWKVISKIATERKESTIILTTHSMEEAEALSTRLAIMVKGSFQCIGTPQHIKSKYGEGMEVQVKFLSVGKKRIQEVMTKRKLVKGQLIKENKLNEVLNLLNASPEDKAQISQYGRASHIYQVLKREKQIQAQLLVQYLEISYISSKTVDDISQLFGQTEILQAIQAFIRIKIKKKPNIGKLFDFFEGKREYYGIQQYTIKQASVEQIFNKFAQNQNESSNRG